MSISTKPEALLFLVFLAGCAVSHPQLPARGMDIYVSGEVHRPGRQDQGSAPTVHTAISAAGGFTRAAKLTRVFVYRADGKILVINATMIAEDKTRDVPLQPGDAIHVPKRAWIW